MVGGIILLIFIAVSIWSGFAYIVWTLANKETGGLKIIGQTISIIIAILVILFLLLALSNSGKIAKKHMMMKHFMMQKMMFENKVMNDYQMMMGKDKIMMMNKCKMKMMDGAQKK